MKVYWNYVVHIHVCEKDFLTTCAGKTCYARQEAFVTKSTTTHFTSQQGIITEIMTWVHCIAYSYSYSTHSKMENYSEVCDIISPNGRKGNKVVLIEISMKLFFHFTIGVESYLMTRKKAKIKTLKFWFLDVIRSHGTLNVSQWIAVDCSGTRTCEFLASANCYRNTFHKDLCLNPMVFITEIFRYSTNSLQLKLFSFSWNS